MRRFLLARFLLARFLLAPFLLALAALVAFPDTARADPRAVIEAQIEAFQEDDFVSAFDYASDNIRRAFGTPERFGRMVRQGYPMVHRPANLRFLDLVEHGGQTLQRLMIADQAQRLHLLEYEMIETDAGWRINGVRILRGSGTGA